MRVFYPSCVAVLFTVMCSYVFVPTIVMTIGWHPNGVGQSVIAAGMRNAKTYFHDTCKIFKWALGSHLHPDCIPSHSQSPQSGVSLSRVVDICLLLKRCSLSGKQSWFILTCWVWVRCRPSTIGQRSLDDLNSIRSGGSDSMGILSSKKEIVSSLL